MKSGFLGILNALHDHRVDFVIVGGVAAALHGGSRVTFDLDVVPSLTPESPSCGTFGNGWSETGKKQTGLTEANPVDPFHCRRDVRRCGPFPVPYVNMPSVSNLPPSTSSDLR